MAGINPQLLIRVAANLTELKANLAQGKSSIETTTAAMSKLAASFQGDKLVQAAHNVTAAVHSIGGASKLTDAELARVNATLTKAIDKYQKLGKEAPPAMVALARETATHPGLLEKITTKLGPLGTALAGAFTVSAVVGFGKELLRMGDEIVRVADRTGLSTKEVQQFTYIAAQSGNTIDELTGAIGAMQNRLASGDKSAVASVQALGINFKALNAASPALQMEMIATAIAKVPDPADRTRVAMDLFGKTGTAILPTLTSQFAKLRAEAPAMSDATVLALDAAGDQLGRFGLQVKVWAADAYIHARAGFDGLIQWAYKAAATMLDVMATAARTVERIPGAGKALDALGINLSALSTNAQWFRDAAAAMGQKTDAVAEKAVLATPRLANLGDSTTKAAAAAKKAAEQLAALTEKVQGLEAGLFEVPDALSKIGRAFDEAKLGPLADAIAKVEQTARLANFGYRGMVDELKSVGIAGEDLAGEMRKLDEAFTFTGPKQEVAKLGTTLKGGLSKALGGMTGIFQSAFEGGGGVVGATKSMATKVVGTVIGMVPVIGPLFSGLAGPIVAGFSKLFGGVEKEVNKTRQAFVDAAGGLGALNLRASEAGVTLTALLNAKKPEAYKKAIDDLNAAFKFQDDAMKALDDTVAKYGFTVEQLGPKFAAQKLHEQAGVLLQDYQVLTAAGVDHTAILEKMAPKLQEYVNTSITAGVAIPAALRPVLQQMVDAGTLTDAAGEKLTDLGGLTFAETLDAKFTTLIGTIEKLVSAISGKLGTAIANVPTNVDVNVDLNARWNVPNLPEPQYAALGKVITPQYFPAGGHVLPFVPRGTDTVPAMLTPGERVLSLAETAAYNAGASGGGGADLRPALDRIEQQLIRSERNAARREALGAHRVASAVRDQVQTIVRR